METETRHIELLAPAKDYASAVDAIDCGADAVYIGASRFGARYAAGNSIEDISRVVEYAHRYGARVYATCNTLLFEEEIEDARKQAESLVQAGVDALIIQDMAYTRMGLPIELHASTQTNCVDVERVRFFEQAGFSRAILERSMSAEQIRQVRRNTSIELEAFIHGAICVCQSGRCFLSRSTSTRSGNRGECSQPCRLSYDLTNGEGETYIKGKHLLSVRDLDLSAHIGELLDAGVTSFKIEGRLKDRIYLRNVVSHYRRILDSEIARRSNCHRASEGVSRIEFTPNPAKSFTRGASEYMFDGKFRGVASFDTPKAIGESIGRIERVTERGFTLDRNHDLATGDGVCFSAAQRLCPLSATAAAHPARRCRRCAG
ncbi:MAG: U32 family peptidase [Alistipes sp.]|nr:U32 family peptidase [Alistipes sp.]